MAAVLLGALVGIIWLAKGERGERRSGSQALLGAERQPPTGAQESFASTGFRIVSLRSSGAKAPPTSVGCLLSADSPEQRSVGLMGVTDLGAYDGIVFRFDDDTKTGFHMKDTVMALSIAWFDSDGIFVSSAAMDPCLESTACPTYYPSGPYRFALEVPKGALPALGVETGSKLVLTPSCQ
ncbi:MAG: DUF192 domain-containing protein [Pseudonocardiaceae bacterium]